MEIKKTGRLLFLLYWILTVCPPPFWPTFQSSFSRLLYIYELRAEDLGKRSNILFLPDELQEVGEKVSDAAAKAAGMATTLWFTKEELEDGMIEHLIACGQFATCYNLLEYLWILKGQPGYQDLNAQYQKDLEDLWKVLLQDWRRFKNDPFFLLKEKERAKAAK